MSPFALRKMIQTFETTGQLGILPGKSKSRLLASKMWLPRSLKPAFSLWMVVRMRQLYPVYWICRISLCEQSYGVFAFLSLQNKDCASIEERFRKSFALQFLSRMVVDVTCPWNILWSD
ncbi:hypothetical protein TNCV_4503191 [Trichonephila clavipes]|nr:hypothetical protein TNCV_4503191 [Trichonephila clavipes]